MKRLAALGIANLSCYLREQGKMQVLTAYGELLAADITREMVDQCMQLYLEDVAADGELEEDSNEHLFGHAMLLRLTNPTDIEGQIALMCVQLAACHYMNRRMGEVFEQICAGSGAGVTIELAARIVCGPRDMLEYYAEIREAYRRVELLLLADYPTKQFMQTTLRMDDRLADWLSDGDDLSTLAPRFVEWYVPGMCAEPIFQKKTYENVVARLDAMQQVRDTGHTPVVVVTGEAYSGRKFMIKQIVNHQNARVLCADAACLGGLDSLLRQLRPLLREVLLERVALVITDMPMRADTTSMIQILYDEYDMLVRSMCEMGFLTSAQKLPLYLTADLAYKPLAHLDAFVINGVCKCGNVEESYEAWEYFSQKYLGGAKLQSRELVVKMKLPIGRIEQVVKRLMVAPEEHPYESRNVFRYCYELLDDGRYDNIKRVETHYTYDDLKLEASQKRIIMDICAQVENRKLVMDDWNLRSRYSYGTCVSALFTGPPGTGKTMAVHVMAGILGLELFKVDLSQLVDKYIGETEKRLEEVFKKAEQSNMILFFDEADAIIGKRSEVKESKDKYANTEVSYLLQRMEEYDGIVILSTNFSQNIDAAFMRRIRYVIHFPIPDVRTRKEIWQSAFSPEVPQEGIDYDYLSNQFEFAGGQIKNIVLNAVFYAVAEGQPVGMPHLVKAIQQDLMKDKKVSFKEALGDYAYLV